MKKDREKEKGMNPYLKQFKGHITRKYRDVKNLDGTVAFIPKAILTKKVSVVLYEYDFLFEISNGAMRLLYYIWKHQKRDSDEIELNQDSCLGFTRATFYRALRELKAKNVLVESGEQDLFYTNINLFFKGSVVKCYPDLDAIMIENKWQEKEKGEKAV